MFQGRTALVTGAASGIGLATAHSLSVGGARVIAVDRNVDALAIAEFGTQVERVTGDVAEPAFWQSLALGDLDHAVVNAGVPGVAPVTDMSFEDWRRVMAVNLDGAFLTLQAALRSMRDGGSIVCVGSAAGFKAEKGIGAYAASKAGLIQLARVAAKESAPRRIRVNVIAPGGVETPIWESTELRKRMEEVGRQAAFDEIAARGTPMGRFAKPEEIAEQIAFLLSDASGTMTGSVLLSDGGYLL
jgi:NAD(P)-dependent dehydrogenase (short-subunit alcohol dehydrogenase family)